MEKAGAIRIFSELGSGDIYCRIRGDRYAFVEDVLRIALLSHFNPLSIGLVPLQGE
jgi:hypothetical protein